MSRGKRMVCCTECQEEALSHRPSCWKFEKFVRGQWEDLLLASRVCCDRAQSQGVAARRGDDIKSRAIRAEALVHVGELSSARQVLEGAQLAPGSQQTLEMLRDQSKRPREPGFLCHQIWSTITRVHCSIWTDLCCCVIFGLPSEELQEPSGMTVEHLQPLLDHTKDSKLFSQAAERLARAQIPFVVKEAVRLGRFTALQKPDGGVRGIVAGDIVRRQYLSNWWKTFSKPQLRFNTHLPHERVASALPIRCRGSPN